MHKYSENINVNLTAEEVSKKPTFSERVLKLLIIGNSGVGKSCILMRYVENNFTTAFYNTIGVDFVTRQSYRK